MSRVACRVWKPLRSWLGLGLLAVAFLAISAVSVFALDIVNLALPSTTFQMTVFPLAQERGYMREEGIELRSIVIGATTGIQAMMAGEIQFTLAGTSSLVAMTRGGLPVKVLMSLNDRVLTWLVSKKEITGPRELKGNRIATSRPGSNLHFMLCRS